LMAVVDDGFNQLVACLGDVQARMGELTGRARTELVINAVADAFLSPTSVAALEILIATRTGRADVDQRHLRELFTLLTALGRYIGDGLDADHADAVGNLIWTTLMGTMVARMAVEQPVDVSRELRALIDIVTVYVDRHRGR